MRRDLAIGAALMLSVVMFYDHAIEDPSRKYTVVEKCGVRLSVPVSYMGPKVLPWLEGMEGLDEDKYSVLIRIPATEVEESLRSAGLTEIRLPQDLSAVLDVLDKDDAADVQAAVEDRARWINERREMFEESVIVADDESGGYKLFYGPEAEMKAIWLLLSRPPPIGPRDLVASCLKSLYEFVEDSCGLSTFVASSIAVEVNGIPASQIRFHREIRQHVETMLAGWVSLIDESRSCRHEDAR